MREMSGLQQGRGVDTLVTIVLRTAFWLAHRSRRVELRLLERLSPGTVPVVAPILLRIPPLRREVITPAEARRRYGYDKPAEAHRAWRARQHARVFGEDLAPSEEGLIESQAVLGNLG
jgi:hypothetical protein